MVENVKVNLPSLIPYLKREDSNFYIEFSFQENLAVPFLIVEDIPPLARIIEGSLMTDGGSKIKNIFILLQNDDYPLIYNELQQFNNLNIEQCWKKTILLKSASQNSSHIILADQIGKENKIFPFRSLFYCKVRSIFFHPPCPQCGSFLELCQDDNLLSSSGIQTYSGSTRRYLYCPYCTNSNSPSNFFTFLLKNSDPAGLKDRSDLIRAFGLLKEKNDTCSNSFPCPECYNFNQCFGEGDDAVSAIIPFSFYPFYMILSEAQSLNSLDFLSLISGASFDEIKQKLVKEQRVGRIFYLEKLRKQCAGSTLFLFEKDDRFFLEVLYLKLSFLGDIASYIFSDMELYTYPDLGLSLNKVWIKFADQSELLPFFWNYKLKILDIGGDISKSQYLPKVPPSYGLYLLGILWFYVLLLNKNQNTETVHSAVEYMIREGEKNTAAFSPENIFWEPKLKNIPENWKNMWEKSLALGYQIIKISQNADNNFSRTMFNEDLGTLRNEIKKHMFALSGSMQERFIMTKDLPDEHMETDIDKSSASKESLYNINDEREIKDILIRIKERWSKARKEEQDSEWENLPGTTLISDDMEGEISSLNNQEIYPEDSNAPSDTDYSDPENSEWDDMPGTVILSSQDANKENILNKQVEKEPDQEPDAPDSKVPEWNDLPGTVILSQDKIKNDFPDKDIKEGISDTPDEEEDDDFLSQTIIISQDDLDNLTKKE